ncbi:helix-turn-helix domain-containing protein [Agromyces larvae]|uniref:Helix-turn-helix domain-containing protein n=1 Tax=Agromyces larvae TaxID=2929802 RepID=A0ABY4C301_9MICO|nr:helix-turn-helix domain-containing protein [Agromyces larvae]UOE44396.1 helix-turn-helix domain-containing protein [Agromyces larvae]
MTMTPPVPTGSHQAPLLDFSAFSAVASSAFVPLAIRSDERRSFRGQVRTAEIDRLGFTELSATAHRVERTPKLISEGGDCYMVGFMLAGSGILVQDGRELVMREGDITIYDTARPFSLSFDDDSKNFVVMLPKDMIGLPPELVGELTATRLHDEGRTSALASQFLLHVPQALHSAFPEVRYGLARTSVGLLEVLLTMALGEERLEQDPHQVLLRKIRDYIEQHLGSPDLTPGEIAHAHHISTRHLHGLFRSQGTTVSGYVRTRRLEHCRQDLVNAVYDDRPVSAIAARWGFIDAAHFSRVFRAQYGATPREVRAQR